MKKFLSLMVTLTVLMSVLCCFPAEARIYDDYPYVYFDFEDQNDANSGMSGNNPVWSAGGANGTAGCMSFTQSSQWGGVTCHFAKPLVAGEKYHASMWLRLDNVEDLMGVDGGVCLIMYTKSVHGNTSYKFVSLNGKAVSGGKWVHCSADFTWDGKAYDENKKENADVDPTAACRMDIRIGNTGNTLMNQLATEGKLGTDFKLKYSLDDIIFEPIISETVYDDSYVLAATFEDGTTDSLTSMSASVKFSVVDDTERGKVMQVVSPNGTFNEVCANNALSFGHLYKVSVWVKRTDDLCTYNGVHSALENITWLSNRKDKENVAKGANWPGGCSDSMIEQNKWYQFTYYIKYDVKTFDAGAYTYGIRMGNQKAAQAVSTETNKQRGSEGVTFLVDDFLIQDLGVVQNGDFEEEQHGIVRYTASSYNTVTPTVFGWFDDGATSAVSTDVRSTTDDPVTTSTKSMSVKVNTDGGKVSQAVRFENGDTYSVSFWAKGVGLADGEEKPISIALDRKVDSVNELDVYDVPDLEYITGDDWTLTNEWKLYTCEFTPDYEAKSTPEDGVMPRTPFLYFDVDGNKAGTEFLIDDITVVDEDAEANVTAYPRAENLTWTSGDAVVGDTITLDYTFVSELDYMEGKSILRALASDDGETWGCLGQYLSDYDSAAYVIPENAVGRYLKLELVPMDEANQMGAVKTVTLGQIKKSFEIDPKITAWSEENGAVTGKVDIECNLSSFGEQNIVVILALYDENNTLVATGVTPDTITVGYDDTITVSASLAGTNAASAKLFVWSGSSLADAGEKIYCEAITYVNE